MNEEIDKILLLARKLKALAERGIEGEKENAIAMLERLMQKHGITMDMINENDVKDHQFFVPSDPLSKKFFVQTASSVVGRGARMGTYVKHPRGKERYFVNCNPSDAIEIQAKYEFFIEAFAKELEVFYSAFIQKNHLYTKPSENDKGEEKELSPEEKEKLMKILQMMASMDRHHFVKQLPSIKK